MGGPDTTMAYCTPDDVASYSDQITTYNLMTYAAVGITFLNLGIVQFALRRAQTTAASLTDGVLTSTTTTTISPSRLKALAAFEVCLGLLKIALGALLLTSLMPQCPEGCECGHFFCLLPICMLCAGGVVDSSRQAAVGHCCNSGIAGPRSRCPRSGRRCAYCPNGECVSATQVRRGCLNRERKSRQGRGKLGSCTGSQPVVSETGQ